MELIVKRIVLRDANEIWEKYKRDHNALARSKSRIAYKRLRHASKIIIKFPYEEDDLVWPIHPRYRLLDVVWPIIQRYLRMRGHVVTMGIRKVPPIVRDGDVLTVKEIPTNLQYVGSNEEEQTFTYRLLEPKGMDLHIEIALEE